VETPLATDVIVDVSLSELERDPYPVYERMRREHPVAFVPETGRVFITTWALCEEAGGDDEVFGPTLHPFDEVYGLPNVMSMTGTEHRRLRNACNPPFRPHAVNRYRDDHLRAAASRRIDEVRPRGRADACEDIFEPISLRAVGDVLGLRDVDDDTIGRWFRGYAAYLVNFGRDDEVAGRGRAVKEEVRAYLERRLPALETEPDDSALSHMLRDGMAEGTTRSVDDLIATVGLMIVGGIQEPAHAAANALYGLCSRPDQLAMVAADPAAWCAKTVEEGLRWLPPFGMTEKCTTADTVLDGVRIAAGTEISMVIGSANRDPERFTDPETFDIERTDQGHQAFGYGMHFCIGHFAARVLAQVMLEEAFGRLPNLRPDPEEPAVIHGWANRAAYRLPIVWDA
jgi:cytochrome P450